MSHLKEIPFDDASTVVFGLVSNGPPLQLSLYMFEERRCVQMDGEYE